MPLKACAIQLFDGSEVSKYVVYGKKSFQWDKPAEALKKSLNFYNVSQIRNRVFWL